MKARNLGRYAMALSIAVAGIATVQAADNAMPNTMAVLKDDLATPGTVRVSKLINTELYDAMGKDVGKIKDVVLDPDYTTIDYTVLSVGTAGLNEKLLALPYGVLSYGGPSDSRLYAQVNKDVLDKAPGFDQSRWPIEASASYYRSLDAYYNTRLSAHVNQEAQPGAAQPAAATLDAPAQLPWNRRATKLIGCDVVSPSGERLGTIKDLVIDIKTGDVRYAVLARGGGLGKPTYYAVPLNRFRTMTNDKRLSLDSSVADLKAIPGFDNDHWPAQADPRWTTATTVAPR